MRTNTGLVVVGFCACSYIELLFLINSKATAELDGSVLIQINGLTASRLVAYLADFTTQLGSDLILGIIAVLVFALSKSNRNLALRLLAVVVLSDAVVFAFRAVYVRPRPYETITNLILPAGRVNDPSFPSGHATRVFGFVTALSGTKGRKYMPATILAVAVGISRVALGVHYPLDVVAGSFLGIALGIVAVVIDEWRGISKRIVEVVGFCL